MSGSNHRARTVGLLSLAFALGIAYAVWLSSSMPAMEGSEAAAPGSAATDVPQPSRTPRPTRTPRPGPTLEVSPTPSPTPLPPKIGIVAGHYQSDSGAVCPDGLQEATINLDVAARVVAILQYEGYRAELLAEFSPSLDGYQADAFVSIHADSCDVPGVSGFKVARVSGSAIPEMEDRLVNCLIREYGQATGLSFHSDTITFDMTGYHAFREIEPLTPGVIIELGFMAADRELLTERSYDAAQGVARGIVCFLEGN